MWEGRKFNVGECQNLLREVEQNILPDREFTKKQKCEVNQVQCEQMYLAQHLYSIERIPDAYGAPEVWKKWNTFIKEKETLLEFA